MHIDTTYDLRRQVCCLASLAWRLVLGALAKLRKGTTGFVMSVHLSVRPSVCMEQLGSYGTDFQEIYYMNIFSKVYRESSIFIKI